MTERTTHDIIYDWNSVEKVAPLTSKPFEFFDETLRDGVQSPSVVDPRIEDKLEILHLMNEVGVNVVDIGLPGAGRRASEDVLELARAIVREKYAIRPACAARTVKADIAPIVDVSQKAGVAIEVMAFIGSSPIRQYAEDWDIDLILRRSTEAIDFAVQNQLPVTYVTEDTTRSRPSTLDKLFRNAIAHGAKRLCICDTVGHATPDGIKNLLRFTRDLVSGTGEDVKIDWHGHNDRGLGVTNTLHALEFGADRVHGTILGIGERVGNAALDQVLVNLKLLGELPKQDLSKLVPLCKLVARATHFPVAKNYPLVGDDAFRTATGVHAAAIIKAKKKADDYLADRVYSGVPAGLFGKEQEIEIGHMSGESNVVYWLTKRRIEPTEPLVKKILTVAKSKDRTLTEDEIMRLVNAH